MAVYGAAGTGGRSTPLFMPTERVFALSMHAACSFPISLLTDTIRYLVFGTVDKNMQLTRVAR